MASDVVTPRSEAGTSAPAHAAAITVMSASEAIAPPCTMSPSVTLVGSNGIRSRTSSPSSTSVTMPSLAANGEAGMNWAMTSAPDCAPPGRDMYSVSGANQLRRR